MEPFQDRGESLPVILISDTISRAWPIGDKLPSGGAGALMVVDTTPDLNHFDRWVPANVLAVFEFGRQQPA